MTVLYYLYTATITILCTVLLTGYVVCFVMRRERKWLLMLLLCSLYLLDEIAWIVVFLHSGFGGQIPAPIEAVWYALLYLTYAGIAREQAAHPLTRGQLVCLVPIIALNLLVSNIPELAMLTLFLWSFCLLHPHGQKEPRTRQLIALSLINSLYAVAGIILALSPLHVPSDRPLVVGFLLLFWDIPLYAAFAFAFSDLTVTLRNLSRADREPDPSHKAQDPAPAEIIARKYGLSAREQEVFQFLIEGRSAKEISQCLLISEGTVKVHIHNIYQKLNINNRRQINQILIETVPGWERLSLHA